MAKYTYSFIIINDTFMYACNTLLSATYAVLYFPRSHHSTRTERELLMVSYKSRKGKVLTPAQSSSISPSFDGVRYANNGGGDDNINGALRRTVRTTSNVCPQKTLFSLTFRKGFQGATLLPLIMNVF